jgi:hypothetical protein
MRVAMVSLPLIIMSKKHGSIPAPAPAPSNTLAPGVTFSRTSNYTLVTVDLNQPGISFASTGRSDRWVQTDSQTSGIETDRQTTRDFITGLRSDGRNAVAAINGDAFAYLGTRYANLRALNISDGEMVSSYNAGGNAGTLLIDRITGARIQTTGGGAFPDLTNIEHAISGFNVALQNGTVLDNSTQLAARSMIALSADNSRLFMYSTTRSVTIGQAATTLKGLGADDAINMDGGGSSSIWYGAAGQGLGGFGTRAVGSSFAVLYEANR